MIILTYLCIHIHLYKNYFGNVVNERVRKRSAAIGMCASEMCAANFQLLLLQRMHTCMYIYTVYTLYTVQ